jgi:hypothetical protein
MNQTPLRSIQRPDYQRLGVNIDHVATIRNARGGRHPDPLRAAHLAIEAGADGITAHLREDRRHISDHDIARLKAELTRPLNFEMAATAEMQAIALKHVPHDGRRSRYRWRCGQPDAVCRAPKASGNPGIAVYRGRCGPDRGVGESRG